MYEPYLAIIKLTSSLPKSLFFLLPNYEIMLAFWKHLQAQYECLQKKAYTYTVQSASV